MPTRGRDAADDDQSRATRPRQPPYAAVVGKTTNHATSVPEYWTDPRVTSRTIPPALNATYRLMAPGKRSITVEGSTS